MKKSTPLAAITKHLAGHNVSSHGRRTRNRRGASPAECGISPIQDSISWARSTSSYRFADASRWARTGKWKRSPSRSRATKKSKRPGTMQRVLRPTVISKA